MFAVALWRDSPVRAIAQAGGGVAQDYASPLEILLSPDGARIYVLCQQTEDVRVLNTTSFAVIKNIPVGRVPRGFSTSASGDRLFVTNSWDDTLSVIDTGTLAVVGTWPVGAEPSSVVADRMGKRLFVANRISGNIAVLDAQTGAEEKRLKAGRGASFSRLPRMEAASIPRIFFPIHPRIAPRPNPRLPSSIRCVPWWSIACHCMQSQVCFTLPSRQMGALAL
jgi:YVTN family beta-propeller protein